MSEVRALSRDEGEPDIDCRLCGTPLRDTVVDLGASPLCESYLSREQLNRMEPFYPLHVHVCAECHLVQLEAYVAPEQIFGEYAYYSSYSRNWVEHARVFTQSTIARFKLGRGSHVVEVASNDGYLLQHFVAAQIPCLGIEPAANVAQVAIDKGIRTLVEFFGRDSAEKLARARMGADLLIGNNVLAQVPDLNDFLAGMKTLLNPRGVISLEYPHVMRTMFGNQFDQIYHEHFSYFSLATTQRALRSHGLKVFDVEELPTHGGSLRVYAAHADDPTHPVGPRVGDLLAQEESAGLGRLEPYYAFGERAKETKRSILSLLIELKRSGKSIVGYGAPGKGNTLLNYCGIRTDFLDYTVDRNPYKQGKFLPGSRIPIYHPDRIRESRPDYVFILPWNLKAEIQEQLAYVRQWGCRFIIPIPQATVEA